jgi:hypothetical protein
LSVVVDRLPVEVPPLRLITIVDPPAVRSFPFTSLAWRVIVLVVPEGTVAGETAKVDWLAEMLPGITVIVGRVEVMEEPPIVAVMLVAVPAVRPLNVAL